MKPVAILSVARACFAHDPAITTAGWIGMPDSLEMGLRKSLEIL